MTIFKLNKCNDSFNITKRESLKVIKNEFVFWISIILWLTTNFARFAQLEALSSKIELIFLDDKLIKQRSQEIIFITQFIAKRLI